MVTMDRAAIAGQEEDATNIGKVAQSTARYPKFLEAADGAHRECATRSTATRDGGVGAEETATNGWGEKGERAIGFEIQVEGKTKTGQLEGRKMGGM